jgi:hypothetical protein
MTLLTRFIVFLMSRSRLRFILFTFLRGVLSFMEAATTAVVIPFAQPRPGLSKAYTLLRTQDCWAACGGTCWVGDVIARTNMMPVTNKRALGTRMAC